MNNLNLVVISGRLTKNPEFIDKGSFQISKFSVAINYNFKKDGEWQAETTYVDCTAWNALAEIVHRIAKRGSEVTVEGRLVQEHWTTQEGQNRSKITIRAAKFNKLRDPMTKSEQAPSPEVTSGEDEEALF